MIIPFDAVPKDTLIRIAEDFITREGTDYGWVEYSLEQKVEQLLLQIEEGQVLITFDEATESVSLVSANDYQAFESSNAAQQNSEEDS